MQFASVAFAKQDSLGLKPWQSYATEAGIADTARFARCVLSTSPVPRIDDGLALGRRIGVRGTPTVVINGWRLARPPYDSLSEVVAGILAGRVPNAATPFAITRRERSGR